MPFIDDYSDEEEVQALKRNREDTDDELDRIAALDEIAKEIRN